MKKMRTILGILLSLTLTATMLPTAVFAAGPEDTTTTPTTTATTPTTVPVEPNDPGEPEVPGESTEPPTLGGGVDDPVDLPKEEESNKDGIDGDNDPDPTEVDGAEITNNTLGAEYIGFATGKGGDYTPYTDGTEAGLKLSDFPETLTASEGGLTQGHYHNEDERRSDSVCEGANYYNGYNGIDINTYVSDPRFHYVVVKTSGNPNETTYVRCDYYDEWLDEQNPSASGKLKVFFEKCGNVSHNKNQTGTSIDHIKSSSEPSHVYLINGELFEDEKGETPFKLPDPLYDNNGNKKPEYEPCGCKLEVSKTGNQVYIFYKEKSSSVAEYFEYRDGYEYEACKDLSCNGKKDGEDLEDKDGKDYEFKETLYELKGANGKHTGQFFKKTEGGEYIPFMPEAVIEAREDDDEHHKELKDYYYTEHYHIEDGKQVEFHYNCKEPVAKDRYYAYAHVFAVSDTEYAYFNAKGESMDEPKEMVTKEPSVTLKELEKPFPVGYGEYELSYISVTVSNGKEGEEEESIELQRVEAKDSNEVTFTPEVELDKEPTVTFMYVKKPSVEGKDAQFFIRLDNKVIPTENGSTQYNKSGYTDHKLLYGKVSDVANINNDDIDVAKYTVAELKALFGAVEDNILEKNFNAPDVNNAIKAKNPNKGYNSTENILLWYVIKNARGCSDHLHVDGIVLENDAEYAPLKYNANAPEGKTVTGLPDTQFYKLNTEAKVATGAKMVCDGYEFMGWSQDEDAIVAEYPYDNKDAKILMNDGKELFAVWMAVSARPTVTVFTYYDNNCDGFTTTAYESGTQFALSNVAKWETEYNGRFYKIDQLGYKVNEVAQEVDHEVDHNDNLKPLRPDSKLLLEANNHYQIHVFYQQIPQGTLKITHHITVKDTNDVVITEDDMSTDSKTYKVGTIVKADDYVLSDYQENFTNASFDEKMITEGVTSLTLNYEIKVPAFIPSFTIKHEYRTIVNGVVDVENTEVVLETVISKQGQPYREGQEIFVKDYLKNRDGYDFFEATPVMITLKKALSENIATIIYIKSVDAVTVNYVDESGNEIAPSVSGEVQRGNRLDEALVLDGKPIKINIGNYNFKEALVEDNVITMIYSKNMLNVVVNYVDTANNTISESLNGQIPADIDYDTEFNENMSLAIGDQNVAIKKAISGYSFYSFKFDETEINYVITMTYSRNNNGGNTDNDDNNGGGYIPRPRPNPTPDEVIDDEETPLAPGPVSPEDDVIPDEDVPLSPADDLALNNKDDGLEAIDDEETPLASAPKTGSTASRTASVLAGAALLLGGLLFSKRRKEK